MGPSSAYDEVKVSAATVRSPAPCVLVLTVALVGFGLAGCGPASTADRSEVTVERGGASGGASRTGGARPPGNGSGGTMSAPVRLANGSACTQSNDCMSGNCADGVCCDMACDGLCRRCNQMGSEGQCLMVAKDQDPDSECDPEPASTCGRDGMCDGSGACQRHAAGTICGPGGCDGATERAASTCDATGVCQPGPTKSCAPAVCLGDSCGSPCMAHSECQTGFFCDASTCRKKRELADACMDDAQCASGFCADGVCCSTACKDKCHSCKLDGAVGMCKPAPVSEDPRRECPVQNITTCGNAGGCDGMGACRLHAAGTFCGHPTCTGATLRGTSTCDGKGMCKPGAATDCAPFVCNGTAGCWTACSNNDQCKAPRTCQINTCR